MSRLKKLLGVIGLILVFFFGGFVSANAKVPEFDGCYLKLSNGKFVEMKLKQARETYINGTSFNDFMNPSQQVAYVTDKDNITSVNNGEIVGIAWRDANIIKFKDYVSVHPLVEKTKAECMLPDDISVVYAPGRLLELRSKSLSKDTYYFKPRDKFPDGEYVVWLGKKFYLFRVGSASQEKIHKNLDSSKRKRSATKSVSRKKQTQPNNNQLTDAERQELEQLKAWKAKASRKEQTNSKPVSQSQTANSSSTQNLRADTSGNDPEVYHARISQRDHYGKNGQKLKGVGIILQQDRANYHKYHKRDREDTGDNRFDTRGNRNKIKRMLARGSTSQNTLDAIRYSTPLVKVRIYKEHIDVTLESKGGQTRQRQHRKTSTQRTTVPVMIGGDPDLDACGATGVIRGISRRGDGFVAARSGPGTKYKMIDKFYRNGEMVIMCDWKGKWVGIVYGEDCGDANDNIAKRKPYEGSCKSGWIFEKYIRMIAG